MRSAFWRRAIPYSAHPHPCRRLLLSALRIPRPVPRTLAARSISTPAYAIASNMATQSDMPGAPVSAPEHEAPASIPAAAAEEAEPKPVAENTDDSADDVAAEPALPPLTPAEFREFNRLADQMTFYHNHFKQSWNILHDAASTGRRPKNMTLKQFLDTGLSFVRGLTMHHDIEETYLYPMLAPKMSEFRHAQGGSGSNKLSQKQSELIQQHRDIHAGMEQFEDYISKCRSREADLEMGVLLEKLDSWGDVLWKHMDQEVETLGAANMRRYYTVSEMRRLRM